MYSSAGTWHPYYHFGAKLGRVDTNGWTVCVQFVWIDWQTDRQTEEQKQNKIFCRLRVWEFRRRVRVQSSRLGKSIQLNISWQRRSRICTCWTHRCDVRLEREAAHEQCPTDVEGRSSNCSTPWRIFSVQARDEARMTVTGYCAPATTLLPPEAGVKTSAASPAGRAAN